jgi:8-oxo-dGTP pyrophosphatase MutT (NUDIX family)
VTLTNAPVQVRDAATVVLLRDGADGLEVAMLRRRLESVFVPGAYVFPGGAVDEHDRSPEWAAVCDAVEVDGVPLEFRIAAVRECFEEAGVLLARHPDGRPVSFAEAAHARRFDGHRAAVDGQHRTLLDVCGEEDLRLDVGALQYLSRWITPEGAPRRYDTRFFVVTAPVDQELRHDDDETIASLWIRPADALDRNEDGDYELIHPTLATLQDLSEFADVAEALEGLR